MFRSTAPRLAMATLVVAAMVPLALPASGANAAPKEGRVRVSDLVLQPGGGHTGGFNPVTVQVEAGDTVVWVLDQGAGQHTVSSNEDGGFHEVLGGPDKPTEYQRPFTTPGTYTYGCVFHADQGMIGYVEVTEPAPPPPTTTTTEAPTTTTTAPPDTTTTTAPAPPPPTTTTTRPRSTTTTTRPATTPATQPPASASDDEPDTTNTTARATTTTAKATTTTWKKKPTTTTKPPETTTTSAPPALPAEWIPTPDMVPDGSPTTTTTAPELQAAADHRPKSGKGGGGGGLPVAGAAGLGVLLLGGLGWAWYHRSSRYLPA